MGRIRTIAVLSDIHYAGPAEQLRGADYEYRDVSSRWVRGGMRLFRHYIWLRNPLAHNPRLNQFFELAGRPDWVIANGDYSCDTGFIGVSDPGAFQSASECLGLLSARYGDQFRAIPGDHEFGKLSLAGAQGGMRLESWKRCREELGLRSIWRLELGRYVLVGITSSLVTIPLMMPDMLDGERVEWGRLSEEHLREIDREFESIRGDQRVILFCHDPSALAFLAKRKSVQSRLSQVEQTVVGHLHSRLVFFNSRILSGMPRIEFLGYTAKRLSTALSEARHWRAFKPRLCPSLAGIELLKDGGFYLIELDEDAELPAKFQFRPIPR